jgi:hypothetical protein
MPYCSPTPPREPTPPPPSPTPLPDFITQFKGTLWFEKFFPDAHPDVSRQYTHWYVELMCLSVIF